MHERGTTRSVSEVGWLCKDWQSSTKLVESAWRVPSSHLSKAFFSLRNARSMSSFFSQLLVYIDSKTTVIVRNTLFHNFCCRLRHHYDAHTTIPMPNPINADAIFHQPPQLQNNQSSTTTPFLSPTHINPSTSPSTACTSPPYPNSPSSSGHYSSKSNHKKVTIPTMVSHPRSQPANAQTPDSDTCTVMAATPPH